MSSSLYRSQVRQHESKLQRLRPKLAAARKKVVDLQQTIARLTGQANKASGDSMRRHYERQRETKERDLGRARDAEIKLDGEVASTDNKLADAKKKLAEAESREQKQADQKAERERKLREWKQRLAAQARERQEERERQERAALDVQQSREIAALGRRTRELEEQALAAERRAAPEEVIVLFLASSPEDQEPLRLDRETREIQKRLRATELREAIWVEWRLARQLGDLIEDLNEVSPHIVHFSGHGDNDSLVFESSTGSTAELSNEQLGRLLAAGGEQIRLAIFNSCNSEEQAEMACRHIDVAIGMNSSIRDDVAKTFAGQFYSSLGYGKSVGEAFRQAVLQIELEHDGEQPPPRLVSAEGVDPDTVVLVKPSDLVDDESSGAAA